MRKNYQKERNLNMYKAILELKTVEEDGLVKVYVFCPDASPMSARFATTYQGEYFRPLDHASLRTKAGQPRYRDIR